MDRVINGQSYAVVMETPVIPIVVQVASGATAAGNVVAWPATIASAGNFTNTATPVALNGLRHYAVGGTLSRTGTVTVQPYLDMSGRVPVGVASSAALTANSAFALDGLVAANVIVQSISITIVNGDAGNAATLSNPILVLQSA